MPTELIFYMEHYAPRAVRPHRGHRRGVPYIRPQTHLRDGAQLPPKSCAMIQGHLNQQRHNTGSTQPRLQDPTAQPAPTTALTVRLDPDEPPPPADDWFTPPCPGARTHHVFNDFFLVTGHIFTDQTSCFPYVSTVGMTDILVLYGYDSNYIHVNAMPSS